MRLSQFPDISRVGVLIDAGYHLVAVFQSLVFFLIHAGVKLREFQLRVFAEGVADQGNWSEDGLFDHGVPDFFSQFVQMPEIFHRYVDRFAEGEQNSSPGLQKGVQLEGIEILRAVTLGHSFLILYFLQLMENLVLRDALVGYAHGKDGHFAVFVDGSLGHAEDAVGQLTDFTVVGTPGFRIDQDRFGFAEDLFRQVIVEGPQINDVFFFPEVLFLDALPVEADALDFWQHGLEISVKEIFPGDGAGVIFDGLQEHAVDEKIIQVALVGGADNDRNVLGNGLEVLDAAQHYVLDAEFGDCQDHPPDMIRVLLVIVVADLLPETSFQFLFGKI